MVCDSLAHYLQRFFGYVRLPQLEYNFSCFGFFFYFFFLVFLPLSTCTFQPLNARQYLMFDRLKTLERTFVRLKSGMPDLREPPQSGRSKF